MSAALAIVPTDDIEASRDRHALDQARPWGYRHDDPRTLDQTIARLRATAAAAADPYADRSSPDEFDRRTEARLLAERLERIQARGMNNRSGWVHGLSDTAYHSGSELSSTFLKSLASRSPAHARAALVEPHPETPALLLGRAVHCRVLEPGTYAGRFVVAPLVDRRTNAGKSAWADLAAAHPGATILTADDAAVVDGIAASIEAHPLARMIFRRGAAEVSGFFTDEVTGAACRIRPDYLRPADSLLIDLKTAQDASPKEFERSIAKFGYHIQAAHYLAGYRAISGDDKGSFLFLAVEKTPPFAVGLYRLDDDAMAEGARVRRRALDLAARCLETGRWPAYSDEVQSISIPRWAYSATENEE